MKKILVLGSLLMISTVLWGCGETPAEDVGDVIVSQVTETPAETQENETDETVQEEKEPETQVTVEEVTEEATEESQEREFSFKDLEDLEFYFSSGAGGWQTTLIINEDGSFQGGYSDSEMGSTGEGYPFGTFYQCDFEGRFTKPVKVNAYTYCIQIEEMGYSQEPGTEEIIDGILYKYAEAHGLADSENLYIYLPESPYMKLPEIYQSWVFYARENQEAEALSFYGLYNEKGEAGFFSYTTSYRIDDMMAETRLWSDTLKASLQNDPLSQMEMNMKSGELYSAWDAALNTLWKELEEKMPEKEFQELLEEQRQWIKDKEAAAEKAGKEAEGGSMETLLRNDIAAEYTEQRVNELYELYKSLQ